MSRRITSHFSAFCMACFMILSQQSSLVMGLREILPNVRTGPCLANQMMPKLLQPLLPRDRDRDCHHAKVILKTPYTSRLGTSLTILTWFLSAPGKLLTRGIPTPGSETPTIPPDDHRTKHSTSVAARANGSSKNTSVTAVRWRICPNKAVWQSGPATNCQRAGSHTPSGPIRECIPVAWRQTTLQQDPWSAASRPGVSPLFPTPAPIHALPTGSGPLLLPPRRATELARYKLGPQTKD